MPSSSIQLVVLCKPSEIVEPGDSLLGVWHCQQCNAPVVIRRFGVTILKYIIGLNSRSWLYARPLLESQILGVDLLQAMSKICFGPLLARESPWVIPPIIWRTLTNLNRE